MRVTRLLMAMIMAAMLQALAGPVIMDTVKVGSDVSDGLPYNAVNAEFTPHSHGENYFGWGDHQGVAVTDTLLTGEKTFHTALSGHVTQATPPDFVYGEWQAEIKVRYYYKADMNDPTAQELMEEICVLDCYSAQISPDTLSWAWEADYDLDDYPPTVKPLNVLRFKIRVSHTAYAEYPDETVTSEMGGRGMKLQAAAAGLDGYPDCGIPDDVLAPDPGQGESAPDIECDPRPVAGGYGSSFEVDMINGLLHESSVDLSFAVCGNTVNITRNYKSPLPLSYSWRGNTEFDPFNGKPVRLGNYWAMNIRLAAFPGRFVVEIAGPGVGGGLSSPVRQTGCHARHPQHHRDPR